MSQVVTQGPLSYVEPKMQLPTMSVLAALEELITKVTCDWEVVNFQPEYHELLLKARFGTVFNPAEIREILSELQQRTQRSFAALSNSARQYVLITVRG
ncbi:MAG: hypothetical protein ACFFBD_28435 [Candidatus Hodarchaeota archaeon]